MLLLKLAARSPGSTTLPSSKLVVTMDWPVVALQLPVALTPIRQEARLAAVALTPHDSEAWLAAFRAAGDGTHTPDMASIKLLRIVIWRQTETWMQTVPLGLTSVPLTVKITLLPDLSLIHI